MLTASKLAKFLADREKELFKLKQHAGQRRSARTRTGAAKARARAQGRDRHGADVAVCTERHCCGPRHLSEHDAIDAAAAASPPPAETAIQRAVGLVELSAHTSCTCAQRALSRGPFSRLVLHI